MSLFAISDLHLALSVDKPMDIFGDFWQSHPEKLREQWSECVTDRDTVVIPGDISWGMTLEEARLDFAFLNQLPGKKILSKGNHDYWWSTLSKMERFFSDQGFDTLSLLKNNFYRVDQNTLLCGTRGWILPCDNHYVEQRDGKIHQREIGRLQTSLALAHQAQPCARIVAVFHYPPLLSACEETEYTRLLHQYPVDICVYGHIHRNGAEKCFEGKKGGILYRNISADQIGFRPLNIGTSSNGRYCVIRGDSI